MTAKPVPLANERANVAVLVEAGKLVADWLEAALACTNFAWDHDQHEAATSSLKDFRAALSSVEGGR
jgi:hypothetical protein